MIKRNLLLRVLLALFTLAVLLMTAWAFVAGPTTVLRILRYGDTGVDDFKVYPGRTLAPAAEAAPFLPDEAGLGAALENRAEFDEYGGLSALLEANDTLAFVVVQDDRLRFERYFQGFEAGDPSLAFSVTKSITSVLVGMAIDDGILQGVDQAVTDWIPELAGSGFDRVTIRHLLTMTSGSSYVENDNPFGEHVILNYTPDLEGEILEFEIVDDPGQVFRYKSGDNAVLGLMLDRALGAETITEYAQRRLWSPLGMQDAGIWSLDHEGDGLEKTWCCLAASARDFAKLGRLLLRSGVARGNAILSAVWIESSTRTAQVAPALWPPEYTEIGWRGYGYQWWLASSGKMDFFALGKDGQFIYIDPSTDTVIVRLGRSSGELRSSEWVRLFQSIAELSGSNP